MSATADQPVTVDELVSLFTGTLDDDGVMLTCPPRRDANAILVVVQICRRTRPLTEMALAATIFGVGWPPDTVDESQRDIVKLGWARWIAMGKPGVL